MRRTAICICLVLLRPKPKPKPKQQRQSKATKRNAEAMLNDTTAIVDNLLAPLQKHGIHLPEKESGQERKKIDMAEQKRKEQQWIARASGLTQSSRDALMQRLQFFCDGGIDGYTTYAMQSHDLVAGRLCVLSVCVLECVCLLCVRVCVCSCVCVSSVFRVCFECVSSVCTCNVFVLFGNLCSLFSCLPVPPTQPTRQRMVRRSTPLLSITQQRSMFVLWGQGKEKSVRA